MTPTATSTISDYAAAVRAELGDLSADQAHAVLDGLDEHLSEIAAESGDNLVANLGSPASYAAELRASAGLEGGPVSRPRVETPLTAAVATPTRRTTLLAEYQATFARAMLAATLGLLAVVTIRATRPLNGFQILVAAAIVAAGWRALRALGRRAQLPEAVAARVPVTLAATALVAAVSLGGNLAGGRTVYIGSPSPTFVATTFGGFGPSEARRTVPNLIGASYEDARDMLRALGFEPILTGPGGAVVTALDPKPGSLAPHGSPIIISMRTNPDTPSTSFATIPVITAGPTSTTAPTTATTTTTTPATTTPPVPTT